MFKRTNLIWYYLLLISFTTVDFSLAAPQCSSLFERSRNAFEPNSNMYTHIEKELIDNPLESIRKMNQLSQNGNSLLPLYRLNIVRMFNDMIQVGGDIPQSLNVEYKKLLTRIQGALNDNTKNRLSQEEMLYMSGDFSVFMDVALMKDISPARRLTLGLPKVISQAEYFKKLKKEVYTHIKKVLNLTKNEVGSSVIFFPTFYQISMEDMVKSPDVMWIGLSRGLVDFDNAVEQNPTSFFLHDLNHISQILSTRIGIGIINKQYESTRLTQIITGVIDRNIHDPLMKEACYSLLFDLQHESAKALDIAKYLVFLENTLQPGKDGLFRESPNSYMYYYLRPAESMIQTLQSGFFGEEKKEIGRRLNRKSRQVQSLLIQVLKKAAQINSTNLLTN